MKELSKKEVNEIFKDVYLGLFVKYGDYIVLDGKKDNYKIVVYSKREDLSKITSNVITPHVNFDSVERWESVIVKKDGELVFMYGEKEKEDI